jgi:hypothetical protein
VGRKQFFFEKKNQKTFIIMARAAGESRDSDVKVFCFFSSEKKALRLNSMRKALKDTLAGMYTRPGGSIAAAPAWLS